MQTQENEQSGASSNSSSGGGANAEMVKREDHERALSDLQKFKKEALEAKKLADETKARLEALEKSKLESSGDFKSLSEQYKSSADEWKNKFEGLKSSMHVTQKHSAASAALAKAGLKPEFFGLLDKEEFAEMQVEATSAGRFIVHGADLLVDNWKKKMPSAFGSGTAPNINTGGGASGGGSDAGGDITPEMLFKCEVECKKKGDMKPYYDMYQKLVEQRAKKQK